MNTRETFKPTYISSDKPWLIHHCRHDVHIPSQDWVEQEQPTLPEHLSSLPVFNEDHVILSFAYCVVSCRSWFVLLSMFFWPLCCLSYFDLRIIITHLVSSIFSYNVCYHKMFLCCCMLCFFLWKLCRLIQLEITYRALALGYLSC
jgi:hypothetical protein